MMPDNYPFNLIRAVYDDPATSDKHIDTIYLRGFYEQVTHLTDFQQEALRLRFQSGYTYKRGAEECQVSLEKFRQTISKALRRLRIRSRYFNGLPQIENDRVTETCSELTSENTLLKNAMSEFTASGIDPVLMARVSKIIQPKKLLTPLYELGLSPRTLSGTQRLSVHNVQEALMTPTHAFTDQIGFGAVSLNDLQNAIRTHLLDIPHEHKKTRS